MLSRLCSGKSFPWLWPECFSIPLGLDCCFALQGASIISKSEKPMSADSNASINSKVDSHARHPAGGGTVDSNNDSNDSAMHQKRAACSLSSALFRSGGLIFPGCCCLIAGVRTLGLWAGAVGGYCRRWRFGDLWGIVCGISGCWLFI